jgi:hypothetical protein
MNQSFAPRARISRRRVLSALLCAAAVAGLLSACQGMPSVPSGPSIIIYDQKITVLGYFIVSRAYSDGPGWAVLYADDKGEPGEIIGQAHLNPGVNGDVRLYANQLKTTTIMYVILHKDLGKIGTFEYPGPDDIVYLGTRPVMTRFRDQGLYNRRGSPAQ